MAASSAALARWATGPLMPTTRQARSRSRRRMEQRNPLTARRTPPRARMMRVQWPYRKSQYGVLWWAIGAGAGAGTGEARRYRCPSEVRMPKRPQGAMVPLVTGPGAEGLSLRDQIYKTCLAAIVDGRLPAGARLPSARQLAADWCISRNTVDDAIARLQAEGFLDRRVGDGTFVAAHARVAPRPRAQRRSPSALGRKALAGVSIWGRSASESYAPASVPRAEPFLAGLPALDAFPLSLWRRLAARRWRVGGGGLLGYFPSLGHLPLREATARHLATARGVDCDPCQIMILNSSMQAVDLIARVLLE